MLWEAIPIGAQVQPDMFPVLPVRGIRVCDGWRRDGGTPLPQHIPGRYVVNWTTEGSSREYDTYIRAWREFRNHPNELAKHRMLETFFKFHVRHNGSSTGALQENLDAMAKNADRLIGEARRND